MNIERNMSSTTDTLIVSTGLSITTLSEWTVSNIVVKTEFSQPLVSKFTQKKTAAAANKY